MEPHFLLKRMTDKLCLFGLRYWKTFSQKWMKWVCHFKKTNSNLLPMIKLEISNKNQHLGKLPPRWAWQLPKTQKAFLMRLVVILMNTIFWYCVIKYVDICNNWKCSPFPSFMLTELPQTKMLPLVFLQSINNMSSLLFRGYSVISLSINSETNLTIQDRQTEGRRGREGGRQNDKNKGKEGENGQTQYIIINSLLLPKPMAVSINHERLWHNNI